MEHPVVTRSYRQQITIQVSLICYRITSYVVPPLALVTNSLSLITFARLYRAKQQVIEKYAYHYHRLLGVYFRHDYHFYKHTDSAVATSINQSIFRVA